ncbi:MAG: lipopolysaccharide kinase InaA family protein [Thermodesulfobacteriota bacterium]|nr:lipopolysaccharide kinase InaA family protein [Thermodesulfobacteriota bacterium]
MKENQVYISPQWQQLLNDNQLNNFEAWWQLELPAVDEGNYGRSQNGWSRVCLHSLTSATGQTRRVVIKRQSNYRSRTPLHPMRGISTFIKEYNFIQRYEQLEIPALKAVYCATRQQGNDLQAILVTEYLDDYRPLDNILAQWDNGYTRGQRAAIVQSSAQLVAKLHNQGLEHRCLFPKHIFVKAAPPHDQACLIDLEKSRYKPWSSGRQVRDLTALARRTGNISNRDLVLFFRHYFDINQLNSDAKKLWHQVEQRIKKKRSH